MKTDVRFATCRGIDDMTRNPIAESMHAYGSSASLEPMDDTQVQSAPPRHVRPRWAGAARGLEALAAMAHGHLRQRRTAQTSASPPRCGCRVRGSADRVIGTRHLTSLQPQGNHAHAAGPLVTALPYRVRTKMTPCHAPLMHGTGLWA